ncbi:MAG: hypothetical protein QOI81_917, partial [Actinomycetota bacterium]|nr:hypothetical protein [Actinomycetota bacterium]
SSNVTTGAVVSGVIAILASFLAAYLGGQRGEGYNERIDRTIARNGETGTVRPTNYSDQLPARP